MGDYGDHNSSGMDPMQEGTQQAVTGYIRNRLGNTAADTGDYKEIAREVSDKFGIILTPGEVKDINRSGW